MASVFFFYLFVLAAAHASDVDLVDTSDVTPECAAQSGSSQIQTMLTKKSMAIEETATFTNGPPSDSAPIPHPGRVIKMGARFGVRGTQDYGVYTARYQGLFADTSKYDFNVVSNLDNIMEYDFFMDMMPMTEYSDADKQLAQSFVNKGGRMVMTGENRGCCSFSNGIITDVVAALGGSFAVLPKSINWQDDFSPTADASSTINDKKLMSGVSLITFHNWATLSVDASVTDVLLRSTDGDIAAVDQRLGKGRITAWADANMFQKEANDVFQYNLVHEAADFVDLVSEGGDPNDPDCLDGECTIWGDPHVRSFDRSVTSLLDTSSLSMMERPLTKDDGRVATDIGDVWLLKHEQLYIQGRYNLIQRRENKPFLRAVAIGGPILNGNSFIVGPAHGKVLWNNEEVLTSAESDTFKVSGLLNATLRKDTQLVQNPSQTIEGVEVQLPLGVRLVVNRHPDILGMRISVLGALKNLDGQCGNFNGDNNDDTPEMVEKRIGRGIEPSLLLFPSLFNPWSED